MGEAGKFIGARVAFLIPSSLQDTARVIGTKSHPQIDLTTILYEKNCHNLKLNWLLLLPTFFIICRLLCMATGKNRYFGATKKSGMWLQTP